MRRGTNSKVPSKAAAFPSSTTYQGPTLKRSATARAQPKQGALSNIWDGMSSLTVVTPKKSHAESSGSLLGKRTRSLHSGTPTGPAACANAELVETRVLVASSDSEEDVEYIAPALQSSKPTNITRDVKLETTPIALDDLVDDDDDDFIEIRSRNKSIRNASRATAGSITLVNASTRANKVDCTSDDIEIVSVTAQQPTIVTTPRRGCNTHANELFMPSSPPLLRPNSPTIRRYNSQSITQPIVLAEDTQEYFGGSSGFAGYIFGDHIGGSGSLIGNDFKFKSVCASINPRVNTAAGSALGRSEAIPETPPLPPQANPQDNSSPLLPPLCEFTTVQQVMRADLSSDPISEFRTPINSPSRANAPTIRFNTRHQLPAPESDSIQFSDDHRDGAVGSPNNYAQGPGITQWYREGLQMCEGDSEEYTQGESQGLEDPSQFLDGFDDELRFDNDNEPESILIGDDSEDDEEMGGNADKSRDTRATIDADDPGYSSPLEGFWDLRKPGAYSERDRAMYLNQFAPSDRQVAMRERKRTQANNAHGSFDVLQNNGRCDHQRQRPRRRRSRGRCQWHLGACFWQPWTCIQTGSWRSKDQKATLEWDSANAKLEGTTSSDRFNGGPAAYIVF
ncbi:hypothetical protein LPJ66_002111 [Kickxella alabastrina]|uniref:Uncharacterized protein n=1 Tax=Kickxella alabastrina TaxID=61397 RepID=A0ACC1IRB9_9FUNG|nr:hypothetical protein LPJ66_002111 [Kickxella alabastrina]